MTDGPHPELYGILAEFDEPEQLVEASQKAREAGYSHFDAYTPFPVHGLAEALGFKRTNMPLVVLVGGIVGALAGYLMQYWITAVVYPINVGGRPLHSWPAFIPVTFEVTILVASLSAVLGMLALNGLPRPYHPLFAIPRFDHASRDGFFLCIEATDPKFHPVTTRQFLEGLAAREVTDVPP